MQRIITREHTVNLLSSHFLKPLLFGQRFRGRAEDGASKLTVSSRGRPERTALLAGVGFYLPVVGVRGSGRTLGARSAQRWDDVRR